MKALWPALLILVSMQFAQATPIHMQLGSYTGVDANGYECNVFLGTGMGGTTMSFFWYLNSEGSYNASTGSDPQPTSPGRIDGSNLLMADGYDQGRPYFRTFYGAPIGTYIIETKSTMHIKGNVLTAFDFTTAPFSFAEHKTICKKMHYDGPTKR